MASDTLVIIPTYNESANVPKVLSALMSLDREVDVLIIDDGSPDGTADVVREWQVSYPEHIHLLEREGKQGLGTAYVAGFRYALEREYEYICEMDADLSHSPEDIPRLVGIEITRRLF